MFDYSEGSLGRWPLRLSLYCIPVCVKRFTPEDIKVLLLYNSLGIANAHVGFFKFYSLPKLLGRPAILLGLSSL